MWYLVFGFLLGLAAAKAVSCALGGSHRSKDGWSFCPQCGSALVLGDADGKERLKCTRCNFVHWDNPKPVSVLLIPSGDGLVLIKRKLDPKAGMHALPGGFVDRGEDPWQAAVREAKEETGLDIEIDRLLGRFVVPVANQILFFFVAKPVSVAPTAGDDAAEARVYRIDEIPANIAFDSHSEMINLWLKESGRR